ncbi:MAG: Ycf66 family protein [Cyanobacterium sp.]
MLSYFLSITIVIASLNLYLSAFIRPKIHRRDDFLWSGLGLFYGLTLWVCAGRITGAILLSQLAIVTVAIAFMWENVSLRKAWIAEEKNTLEGFSILSFVLNTLAKFSKPKKKKEVISQQVKEEKTAPSKQENFPEIAPEIKEALEKVEEEEISQFSEITTPETEIKQENSETVQEIVTDDGQEELEENLSPEKQEDFVVVNEEEKQEDSPPMDEEKDSLVVNEIESPQKKSFFGKIFGGIFGGKKKKEKQETSISKEDEEIGDNFIDNPEEDSNEEFFEEEESKSNSSEEISTVIEEETLDLPIDEKTLAEFSPDEQIISNHDDITDIEASADDETVLEEDDNTDDALETSGENVEEESSMDDDTVLDEVSADEEETVLLEASPDDETLLEDDSFYGENEEKENDTSISEEEKDSIIPDDITEEKENISLEEEVELEIPVEDTINSFDDITDKLNIESVKESDNWDFLDDEGEKKEDELNDETVGNILDDLDKKD